MVEIQTFESAKKLETLPGTHRVVVCKRCNQTMEIVEGTVLFDANWFHESCWESTKIGGVVA